jgi:hypothetical protein
VETTTTKPVATTKPTNLPTKVTTVPTKPTSGSIRTTTVTTTTTAVPMGITTLSTETPILPTRMKKYITQQNYGKQGEITKKNKMIKELKSQLRTSEKIIEGQNTEMISLDSNKNYWEDESASWKKKWTILIEQIGNDRDVGINCTRDNDQLKKEADHDEKQIRKANSEIIQKTTDYNDLQTKYEALETRHHISEDNHNNVIITTQNEVLILTEKYKTDNDRKEERNIKLRKQIVDLQNIQREEKAQYTTEIKNLKTNDSSQLVQLRKV